MGGGVGRENKQGGKQRRMRGIHHRNEQGPIIPVVPRPGETQ